MRIMIFAALGALLSGTAWAGTEADDTERLERLERGEIFAEQHCAACHAIGWESVSPHPEAPPFRVLHERYPVEFLAESLAEGIMVGHPEMPEFQLSEDEIDAFLAYLKSLEP